MAISLPCGPRSRCRGTVLLAVLLAAAWLAGASAWAAEGDVLYGALVLATVAEHPAPPPESLKTQADNLRTVFGYNQFRLLGEKRNAVPTSQVDWLVSSRQFFLRVGTKEATPEGYALGLELLKDDKPIVAADVKLSRERPLFIRGPFVGQGQLIILLMVL